MYPHRAAGPDGIRFLDGAPARAPPIEPCSVIWPLAAR